MHRHRKQSTVVGKNLHHHADGHAWVVRGQNEVRECLRDELLRLALDGLFVLLQRRHQASHRRNLLGGGGALQLRAPDLQLGRLAMKTTRTIVIMMMMR